MNVTLQVTRALAAFDRCRDGSNAQLTADGQSTTNYTHSRMTLYAVEKEIQLYQVLLEKNATEWGKKVHC